MPSQKQLSAVAQASLSTASQSHLLGQTPVLSRAGLSGTSLCPRPRISVFARQLPEHRKGLSRPGPLS